MKSLRATLSAGALFLVFMAGHTVLETARDSLFLAREPITELPFAYLSIAVAALLATELHASPRVLATGRHEIQLITPASDDVLGGPAQSMATGA